MIAFSAEKRLVFEWPQSREINAVKSLNVRKPLIQVAFTMVFSFHFMAFNCILFITFDDINEIGWPFYENPWNSLFQTPAARVQHTLRWRHNESDGDSNHQSHDCLPDRLKKTEKLRVTGLCAGNSPVTVEFPAQRTSYAKNVSIWWRHHD